MEVRLAVAFMILAGTIVASIREPVCLHPSRGAAHGVSLDQVESAQARVKARLAGALGKIDRLTPASPFDSGLPACRGRGRRTLRTQVPRELVGKTAAFGPSGRIPASDIRVATSVKRIAEIEADAMASPALVRRLGVRCRPTRVRFVSENELELLEGP